MRSWRRLPFVPRAAGAAGYFVREQRFGGTSIFLWPTDDESYVRELVYDWGFADGTHRIVRWTRGFKVSLDGDLADSETLVAKVQETVAELVRTTGLPITVGPGGECLILIDPNILEEDNAIAETTYTFQGPTIVGSRVLFATRREIAGGAGSDYRNTLLLSRPRRGPGRRQLEGVEGPDHRPALGTDRTLRGNYQKSPAPKGLRWRGRDDWRDSCGVLSGSPWCSSW